MALGRQQAAWLLGLEGAALLRHGAGDDVGDLDARLSEARRIVDEIDARSPTVELGEVSAREGYATWAASYDRDTNPLLGIEQAAVWPLLDALAPGRVLDAACGTGRHATHLARRGHEVISIDLCAEMLAHAPEPRAQADVCLLPLADRSVDAAVCALALTHLPALEPAVAELARVVRPGGTIVISDIHVLSLHLGGVARVGGRRLPASRHLASDYISAAHTAGLEILACEEPRWGVVPGAGGPLAQQWCRDAAAAAYRDTPAAIVWCLRVP